MVVDSRQVFPVKTASKYPQTLTFVGVLVFDSYWKHAIIVAMVMLVVFRKDESSCLNKM